MKQNYVTIKVFGDVGGELFGTVNRAVLASCTAEIDAEIGKLSLNIPGDGLGD